jgi:HD-GYP domain-containing protein (c-di-GMP phosphodiesterase class II)
MTLDHPYRRAPNREEAVVEPKRVVGTHLDPARVAALRETVDRKREESDQPTVPAESL